MKNSTKAVLTTILAVLLVSVINFAALRVEKDKTELLACTCMLQPYYSHVHVVLPNNFGLY